MIPAVLASVLGVVVLVSVFGLWASRRRLASELQEAVRIVELANDPILVADIVRGQVVHANQAACRLLGYRAEQLLTKALPDLHPQRSISRSAEIIADVWEKKGLVYSEIPFMRADGSEIPVEVSANVFQFRGRPAILLFARDQRERLRLEQQLVQSEKMASLGQLVAGVAHEINTPMGSIHSNIGTAQSAIELLERALARDDVAPILAADHKLGRALAILKESCEVNRLASERIVGIVGSLRNFARLDEADRKRVDLNEGIESTLTLLRHQIKHGIEVVREYGPDLRVVCYPNQLNQVFMNVLLNAVQSMDGKGTITISSERREHEVEIRIRDTGKGIAPENLPRVFDPGFTTKGVGVGTGLGLSIAYQIMKKHAGSIECQSELGVGTTFTLRLPIEAKPG
jgi:two-component system NtrC family sensor kinase